MDKKSFTVNHDFRVNMLQTPCKISKAYDPSDPKNEDKYLLMHTVTALWDTGATGTVITKKLAETLQLEPQGQVKNYHANGECITNVYYINIFLPNEVGFSALRVIEGDLNGIDILIGMDIIGMGDFAVTHPEGKTKFTFQIPATHDFDFVKENNYEIAHTPITAEKKQGRNEPCACGSGKKHKNCCAKK
ncbi:MAG: retroviral-like aspartic protease family protein [Bacteroidales bacterium]|nr:retroviral-like aspartic protease family protein [Bacteroidales bacterium]MCL2133687.1 retroviral-like aspartic protease family protein [Bacteroidales bacterium]